MYEVTIKNYNDENNSASDFIKTFADVVKFIARETGMSQREVRSEISARSDSKFKRDKLGFRVQVWYSK